MAARRQRPARIRPPLRGALLRRVAVTLVAGALVIAAEIAATLSPPVHKSMHQRPIARLRASSPSPEPGEPELPPAANVSLPAQSAAVTFVHDYALWSSHRARTIPAGDATRRVLVMLEREGRRGAVQAANAVASVRIASASGGTYVVTSAVGNFLMGRKRSQWLVLSLPGD
jgi:hypothetical protein